MQHCLFVLADHTTDPASACITCSVPDSASSRTDGTELSKTTYRKRLETLEKGAVPRPARPGAVQQVPICFHSSKKGAELESIQIPPPGLRLRRCFTIACQQSHRNLKSSRGHRVLHRLILAFGVASASFTQTYHASSELHWTRPSLAIRPTYKSPCAFRPNPCANPRLHRCHRIIRSACPVATQRQTQSL